MQLNNNNSEHQSDCQSDNKPDDESNTLRLIQEFNEKHLIKIGKAIDISDFSIMKDDIKNYKPLTNVQLEQLKSLSEIEKIEIIKIYNIMFSQLINIIN